MTSAARLTMLCAAAVCLAIGGCQKAPAPANAAAATSPAAAVSPAAAALTATLPQECQALFSALQACSDHLTATHSPGTAFFRKVLDQTRQTLPAAAGRDPDLPAQCAKSLKEERTRDAQLGC